MADFANDVTLSDLLGPRKVELIATVKEDVVPFFAERGIEVTTIGQFGGFRYENPKIQEAIDQVGSDGPASSQQDSAPTAEWISTRSTLAFRGRCGRLSRTSRSRPPA